MASHRAAVLLLFAVFTFDATNAFVSLRAPRRLTLRPMRSTEEPTDNAVAEMAVAAPVESSEIAAMAPVGSGESAKSSLASKMRNWEANEEEMKAASLGGLTPGKKGVDGFDIGLLIAFPFMVVTGFIFFAFPLLMDKLQVIAAEAGPPPMI